jgi:hypothetical protein
VPQVPPAPADTTTITVPVPQQPAALAETGVQPPLHFHGTAPGGAEPDGPAATATTTTTTVAAAPQPPVPRAATAPTLRLTGPSVVFLTETLPSASSETSAVGVRPDPASAGFAASSLPEHPPPASVRIAQAATSAGGAAGTGVGDPLPARSPLYPPSDPTENPTGLGGTGSGGGSQGSVLLFAVALAGLSLFVPRLVRRIRVTVRIEARPGYRLLLERPG